MNSTTYKINQKVIIWVRGCFLFGMPLIVSFVVSSLEQYRILSFGLIVIAYFLNHSYPDRIRIEQGQVHIKLYLKNDWISMSLDYVTFVQEKRYVYICIEQKRKYRISMAQMPVTLYRQLKELPSFYQSI